MAFDATLLTSFTEYRMHKAILVYVIPFILAFGLTGNLLSFAVLTQPAMRQHSTYLYLAMLSIADTMVLLLGALRTWVGEMTGNDIRDSSQGACKFVQMICYTFSDYSVWLLVAVTAERYVIVMWPLRASVVCIRRRALTICAGMFSFFLLINSHFAWTVELRTKTMDNFTVTVCAEKEEYTTLVVKVWPWVDAAFYSIIPFALLTFLNVQIVFRIWSAKRMRRLHLVENPTTMLMSSMRSDATTIATTTDAHCSTICGNSCNNNTLMLQERSSLHAIRRIASGSQRHQQASVVKYTSRSYTLESELRLTIMLLTVTFTFLASTLPVPIVLIVTAFYDDDDGMSMEMLAKFLLTNSITQLLMYVNHSINFYLYCATGHKFCNELKRLSKYTNVCKADNGL